MKQTRREYLGLYLYAKPTCDALVAYNKEIREKALAICCMRQTAIINEEFGFMDHNKKKQISSKSSSPVMRSSKSSPT